MSEKMRTCPENEDMSGKMRTCPENDLSGKWGYVWKMRICPENDLSGKWGYVRRMRTCPENNNMSGKWGHVRKMRICPEKWGRTVALVMHVLGSFVQWQHLLFPIWSIKWWFSWVKLSVPLNIFKRKKHWVTVFYRYRKKHDEHNKNYLLFVIFCCVRRLFSPPISIFTYKMWWPPSSLMYFYVHAKLLLLRIDE
jgi:hypothetical protein